MAMYGAPPSVARRGAAGTLILWLIWMVLFILIMSLIGTTSTDLNVGRGWGAPHNADALGLTAWLMLSAWVVIMVLFLVFADLMFLSSHTYVNSIFDPRRLRGINLGFSISSLVMFPPLAVIGIPLTLVGLSRPRWSAWLSRRW